METKGKTTQELIDEYYKGNRDFYNLDFSPNPNNPEKFKNLDLSGSKFTECSFHSCHFDNVNLENCEFNHCDLRCVVLSDSDLSNSKIINCSIEANIWRNVKTRNMTFLDNSYYGVNLSQDKFENLKQDFEEAPLK